MIQLRESIMKDLDKILKDKVKELKDIKSDVLQK